MRNLLAAISAIAAAAALSASAAPAQAATTLNAHWDTGCGKSTCFNDQGVFIKTWNASASAGPLTIGQLLLDRGILGSLDGSTFRLSFQIEGKELGSWGSFTMGGIAGDELIFQGENFTWNPEDGDLTLVLEIFKPKEGAGGFGSFGAPGAGPPNSDSAPPQTDDPPNFGGVMVDAVVPSAAPEPAAWALMISGLGLAGAMLRRRTRVVA